MPPNGSADAGYSRRFMEARPEIDPSALAAVDDAFASFHAEDEAPGLTYAVVANGTIVHASAVGVSSIGGPPMHADSVLRVASMTKSFTAATVLLLRDEGLLALDEPIGTYVPELRGQRMPTADSPTPTLRMLLTMSAGLPTDDPWADREESMTPNDLSALLAAGLSFSAAPGTGFQYANLGYVIAGRAIAEVTGQRYHDIVRTRLLEPLGMSSTGFAVADVPATDLVQGHHKLDDEWMVEPFSEAGEFSPLGGIFSSVTDLATWVGGFTDAFPARDDPDDGHPLSRASRREMQQMYRFNDVTVPAERATTPAVRARAIGYGFGLGVTHDTRWGQIVGHSGGYPGYGSNMRWHPTTGVGVIALANGRYTPASKPAAAALEIVLASLDAPSRRVVPWDRTLAMQQTVQSLVQTWDDDVADAIFAANVDADLDRRHRRAEVQAVTEQLGAIAGIEAGSTSADNPSDIEWWIAGEHGRAQVDLQLTPHAVPLVQTFGIEFVGQVSDAVTAALDAVVAQLAITGDPDATCTSWRSEHDATFRIRAGVDEWKAVVVVDPDTGETTSAVTTPIPPSANRFDVTVLPE